MNLFVTGASGLLGSAFVRLAALRGHRVIGAVRSFRGPVEGLAETLSIDLTDERAIRPAVLAAGPDAIVNCAAVSAPAECDSQPERAQRLNVGLPRLLAEAARELGARLVHVSSEQVFDGESALPYAVTAPTSPLNRYGRQKAESELAVRAAAGDLAATLRPPLLLGNSLGGIRSLHEQLLATWAMGRVARLYTDEFRQPCTTDNLAEAMLEICGRGDLAGVFHWAGTELISRYELACRLRSHFGLTAAQAPIAPLARADTPEVARTRPRRLELDLRPLAQALKTRPQSLEQQFEQLRR